ncbi:MAG: ribbon-helix-helix domain-containing protein [Alphaproteobacteria bacterium]|nr:ribbon-helix-helix domain-containing protein [Alphaproteobacteria bacterium]
MEQDDTLQAKSPENTAIAQQLLGGELISKNVRIAGRRTSVRLEPEMWEALDEVAAAQGCTIHDLCSAVAELKHPAASFTGALRVFVMEYFRSAAKTNRPVGLIQKRIALKDSKSG